jgi:hypothetical protein
MYERHAIAQAAQQLGTQLTATRLRAIDSSIAYRFEIEIGGRGYRAQPAEAGGPNSTASEDGSSTLSGELPEEMSFEQSDSQPLMQAPGAPPQSQGSAREGGWMLATLWLPDGSAVDSAFVILDALDNQIHFDIRGLTGAVRVGDPERRPSR